MNESLLDQSTNNTVDPNKDYFKDLVGDGKKFKSPEDLARGKYEADMFIETLKRQQDELRSDYLKLREEAEARARLEDLIGQLENRQNTNSNNPPEDKSVIPPTFKPEEIENLVSKKLQELESSRKEQDNFRFVSDKLKEQLGEDYQNLLKTRINDMGLTEEYVNEQARKYPKALLKMLGVDETPQKQNFQAPPQSAVRSDNFAPRGAEKRTWTYYQKMKQDDPKRYYSSQTNIQMHNDAIELGDSFKDGDYHRYGD